MIERNLFNQDEIENAEINEQNRNEEELSVCIKCGIKPVVHISGNPKLAKQGYHVIECERCGYSCGTFYDNEIISHWNACNTLKHRKKEFE